MPFEDSEIESAVAGPVSIKILIAGGFDRGGTTSLSSTELYDPVADAVTCIDGSQPSGTPSACPSSTNMIDSRAGHTATVLSNGKSRCQSFAIFAPAAEGGGADCVVSLMFFVLA